MLSMISVTKKNVSTYLVSILAIFIVLASLVSEFFQAPVLSSRELSKLQFLFSKEDILKINNLNIKTVSEEFNLEKDNNASWSLTTPRNINANSEIISSILKTLEDIKIKRIYPKDQINLANFSLDNPISTITIKNQENEVKILSFGLVNPIDNSTYMNVNGENAIYHINMLHLPFERLELAQIIDSQIFNFKWNQVKDIKIYGQKQNSPSLLFTNDGDKWTSENMKLDDEKVHAFLNELTQIKSHTILDKVDEKLSEEINGYLSTPFFKLNITTTDGVEKNYDISYLVNSLSNVKIEKRQDFIIRASNRKHPFLINKEFMKVFYRKSHEFKESSIKKLIY